jgi:hypothetical protein
MKNLHDIHEAEPPFQWLTNADMARAMDGAVGLQEYQRLWIEGTFRQEYLDDTLMRPPRIRQEIDGIVTELYQRAYRIRAQMRDTEGIAMVITPEERTRLYYELIRTELLRPDGEGQDRFMGIPIVVP